MSIKKDFYKMNQQEFEEYLRSLKNDRNTIKIFNDFKNSYFYYEDRKINYRLIKLYRKQLEIDFLFNSFTDIQQQMIKESLFIEEIKSTNKIENINSLKASIFNCIHNNKTLNDKKIISIVNAYKHLDDEKNTIVKEPKELRNLYDALMEGVYESFEDVPDGLVFRKNNVEISDGIRAIHNGLYPEDEIIKGIEEYIEFINDSEMDEYLNLFLSHFMFETIHPFYDGNGRFGRYLMTLNLLNKNKSLFARGISTAINKNRNEYYKAFKYARDVHEYGSLNEFVVSMINIFESGMDFLKNDLQDKYEKINEEIVYPIKLTKSEKEIYRLLFSASILTDFGLSIDMILEGTNISRRTLISTLQKLRTADLLCETRFSKTTYHKLKNV